MKLLFRLLKNLPSFQKLLTEWFAAENTKTEKALADYKLKSLSDAAEIERLQRVANTYKQLVETYLENANALLRKVEERDAEIERLQSETQQRLKALSALDSESIFNASLSSAVARDQSGAPPTERQLPVDGGRR